MVDHITIDGTEYAVADFSQEARAQLEMMIAADRKLAELKIEISLIQTARNACAASLVTLLPSKAPAGFSVG